MKYKANILVVDDEPSVCKSIASALESEGYVVDTVLSEEEALAKESETKYAVVIVDLMLPGMGGLGLLTRLKERDPNTTVIMVTGFPSVKTAVQSIKFGAFDYIPKPFTPDELRRLVESAVERRHFYETLASKMGRKEKKLVEIILPPDLYCIPEHSWAKIETDGNVRVGVHHVFVKNIYTINAIDFPGENELIQQGNVCLKITDAHDHIHRLWSPITGRVIAVNNEIKKDYSILVLDPYNKGWLLLLEPMQLEEELKNLKDVHSDFDHKYHLP